MVWFTLVSDTPIGQGASIKVFRWVMVPKHGFDSMAVPFNVPYDRCQILDFEYLPADVDKILGLS
jgi:hypothetical protein